MVDISPVDINVTDTAYKPASLVGGSTALSDETDATYAEQWLSIRGGLGDGPLVVATFDPAPLVPTEDWFRFRFEVFNDNGATGTTFFIALYSGLEVGVFYRGGEFNVDAPATDTIYDWADWTFVQTGTKTLAEAFADGFNVRARRVSATGGDGDYGIRVYEITATGAVMAQLRALRRYPRDDTAGFSGVARTYPPPRHTRLYSQQP